MVQRQGTVRGSVGVTVRIFARISVRVSARVHGRNPVRKEKFSRIVSLEVRGGFRLGERRI